MKNFLFTTCLTFLFSTSLHASQQILIIGSGGREHAITQKVLEAPSVSRVYVAPGNGGTAQMDRVQNVAIKSTDIDALVAFAKNNTIDLTIVGPEIPLALGIVNRFSEAGLRCFGPTQAAAQIETSKKFAKDFMQRHRIPTAPYATVTTIQEAKNYIANHDAPIVVKADGLAAGKGVIIAHTKQEARDAALQMLSGDAFGDAGRTVVFEQFLQGQEVSFFALSDGEHAIPLTTAQDYKRVGDDDAGPNTGGMGAYSPAPCITQKLHDRIMHEIIEPTIAGLAQEGKPFVGFLYAGLMITSQGDPYVIEFNCRLGDPETQVILPRLQTDLVALCSAALDKKLDTISLQWYPRKAVTVVIADSAYPQSTHVGQNIHYDHTADTILFHAATAWKDNQCISTGGRILAVTSLADSFNQARKNAYDGVRAIQLPHMRYRKDIAKRVSASQAKLFTSATCPAKS